MTFMTNEEWAQKMNYTSFAAYLAEHDVPVANTLTMYREDMHGLIVEKIGGTPDAGHEKYLRGLEFTMVNNELDLLVFRTITRDVYSVERKRLIESIDKSILTSIPDSEPVRSYGWGT